MYSKQQGSANASQKDNVIARLVGKNLGLLSEGIGGLCTSKYLDLKKDFFLKRKSLQL